MDAQADQVLLESLDRGLLTLTLNRPDRRNALNPELGRRLVEATSRAASDPAVRAILLKGAGGTFCVGGDVKAMAAGTGHDETLDRRFETLRQRVEVSRLLHDMRKPTIAMIAGAAAGAGLAMALACDLRIAGKSAKLTTAFAKVGLSGDYGGTYFLTRLVGSAKARELYLMSPILTADEALAMGLLTRVVPDDELEAAAQELAMSLAQGPSIALGYIKQNINTAERSTIDAVLDTEAMNHVRCTQTEDHREAAKAFVEKRKVVFGGR
jgi:2-(1,2-epoxy-1,2-dihydrophenyl)acetyl-CoA isomerase